MLVEDIKLPKMDGIQTNGDLIRSLNDHIAAIEEGNLRFGLLREYRAECLKLQSKLRKE